MVKTHINNFFLLRFSDFFKKEKHDSFSLLNFSFFRLSLLEDTPYESIRNLETFLKFDTAQARTTSLVSTALAVKTSESNNRFRFIVAAWAKINNLLTTGECFLKFSGHSLHTHLILLLPKNVAKDSFTTLCNSLCSGSFLPAVAFFPPSW